MASEIASLPWRPDRSRYPSFDISFEFFPPKTEASTEALWECVQRLAPLKPKFVSVTYGAGGTTRERTHDIVARIRAAMLTRPTW